MDDHKFEKFRNTTFLHNSRYSLSFKDIENRIDPLFNYDQKISMIGENKPSIIDNLLEELRDLEKELIELKNKSLSSLINQQIIKDLGIKIPNFLFFLIKNNFIEEDFQNYTSYFYEGDVHTSDKEFILKVRNDESNNFDYSLNDPELVAQELFINDFKRDSAFNYDLLEHLLDSPIVYHSQIKHCFENLNENKKNGELLTQNLYRFEKVQEAIVHLARYYRRTWIDLSSLSLDQNQLALYSTYIIDKCSISEIKNLAKYESLLSFMESSSDFLELLKEMNFDHILEKLARLNYTCHNLPSEGELYKKIVHNGLYDLSLKNTLTIIGRSKGLDDSSKSYETQIFTSLSKLDCQSIESKIHENEDFFVQEILTNEENINESENSLMEIINNTNVSNSIKKEFLDIQVNKISSILSIDKEYWDLALISNIVFPSINNLKEIYKVNGEIDLTMINFINLNHNRLSSIKTEGEILNTSQLIKFEKELILSNELTLEAYSKILGYISNTKISIEYTILDIDKFKKIIETQIISFDNTNLKFLSIQFQFLFILENLEIFISKYTSFQPIDILFQPLNRSDVITKHFL